MVSALRSHSLLFALILGLSLTNAACSDTASGKSGAASDAGGAAADVGVVGDGAGAKDVLSVDAQSGGDAATPDGTGSGDTGAGGGGTEDGGGTIPDDFDKPCQTNADCLSGYCMPAGDGKKVCSTGCSKTCPSGFSCQGVKKEGQTAFVCVPVQHNDCAPCEDLSQCGATDEVCGVVGAPGGAPATYCLRTCKANGDCPSGSACEDVAGKAGADLGKACVPKTGSCVCTATLDGTQQDCSETNSFGTCKGERSCAGAKGWSVCSAAKPAAETCDGQDNDCDGSTDEGIAAEACTVTNSFGTCTGSQSCKGSKGLVCDAPTPATETCDGSDNDCDGDTDEGYPDIDWDGQKDCVDKDDDDDGVADSVDDCPKHPDPKQLDFDKDGKGDACDSDDDGDGIADGLDNCKLAKNADQKDTDGDGEGDACDLDDDGDLDPDTKDCAPLDKAVGHLAKELCDGKDNDCDGKTDELFGDTDGDGKMDCVDTDDDGDGSPDKDDCEPQNKLTHPGAKEVCDGLDNDCNGKTDEGFADLDKNGVADCLKKDADGDGSPDGIDCKPTNKAVYPGAKELCDGLDNNCSGTTDEGFADTDGDKLMDCIDPDDDGDGDPDPDKDGKGDCSPKNASISHKAIEACNGVDDNCDGKTDEGYPDSDGDKVADCADKDDDGDGILDGKDNCPITKNPKQVDTDGDGVGDACDDDADNDGVSDSKDNCKGTKNSSQLDMDKDGIGDACDGDDDGDGSPDKADCAPLNTAVFPGAKELCNGIDDSCDGKTDSGFTDTDGDKLPDCIDPDDDNDGALDGKDCAPTDATVSPLVQEVCDGKDNDCDKHLAGPKNPNAGVDEGFKDTDGDKQADCIDSDDDGDGKPDAADNCPLVVNKDQKDTDKDGLGDVCDPSPAGKISKVLIRTAPGGGGIVVGALKAKLGETFTMYAAAYTDKGLFGGDIAVSWGATGTLTGITAGPSVKLTWSPKKAGQAGTITAAPKDKAVTQAATGLIEVVFPPPGEVHAGHSTVSTSRSWAETDGKQTVEITVLLKDVYEQAVVKPQTVQIQTTLGTLTGAVKSLGGGRYSQVLTVGTKPGYAKITVTAGGKKLSAEPVVQFVEVDQLPDKFKLDCSNYAKFKGHSLQIKKTTVTIDSVGCAPMVFAHIFVTDGGVLTHTAYNATTKKHQAIDLDVASLWVDSGAKIDVTARGYSKYVSAPDVKGAGGYGGGSHGGRGGLGTVSGAAFDDMTDPHLPGGGGGSNWGGVGGGVVRVHVRTGGKLVVHGAILANGNNSYYGGGAGGAISLSAPQVGGVGEIKALGGYGWKSKYASSGGGGGGRIAVTGFTTASGTFDISNWAGKMSAAGGTSYHSDRYGGAGTVWVQAVSGDRGSLVVDNIGRVAFVGSTPLLTAGVGTNELWTNGKLGDNEATWAPGTLRGSWVNVNPAKGTDSLADDAIVRVLDNDKTSLSLEGGKTALSSKGAKFSGIVVVDHLDVLGGASLGGSLPAGGADVLVWKGNRALKAPAGSGPTFSVKGGLVLPRLEVILAQTLRVEGAAGKRIALNLGQLDANGGPGKPLHLHLSHSTLALPKVNALDVNAVDTDIATSTLTAKALDMKDGKLDAETLQVFGDATLSGKNLTTIGKDLMEVGGALELRDTAAIWPKAPVAPKTGEKPEIRRLKLSASWLTVQKSAAIRADARGFTKGVIPTGTAAPTASWSYTGGSHGGLGSPGSGINATPAYDRLDAPSLPGAAAPSGGLGGGVIDLQVSKTLRVDGQITATGQGSTYGGGAGGTVTMQVGVLDGTGVVSASGGNGSYYKGKYGGAGAGGRIALTGHSLLAGAFGGDTFYDHIQARGGLSSRGKRGGAGTVFVRAKGETRGDLWVHNTGDKPSVATPLLSLPKVKVVEQVTGGVRVDLPLIADRYANAVVLVGGGDDGTGAKGESGYGKPGIAGDPRVTVAGNTIDTLLIAGKGGAKPLPADLPKKGTLLRTAWVFDRLHIGGGALLTQTGALRVVAGDVLHAADAKWKSNMWLGATVQADLIDLPPLTAMTLSKGGVVTQHFIVGGSATPTLAWTGDGGLIELPAVQATTLTWKGGMLRTPKLSTTGKTTLDTAGTDIGAWLAGGDVVSTDGAPETDTLNLTGNLALKGKSQFIVRKEQAKISGALTLSDTAQLRAVGGASSPRLVVSAKTVDVAKGAAIHADLAGPKFADLPGYVAENGSGYTGGSHGGTGRAISGTAQSTFGDVRLPNTPGGAGPKGALGGGVVIVNASQRFTHHGRLSANGQSYGYGGGAGGSVRVHTPELHGAGFIEALGGTGGKSGGGGGGGRVALYVSSVLGGNFQPSTWSTGIRTWGGLSSAVSSGAGTLFVMRKGSVHGDLVVQAQSLTYTSVASRAVVLPETKVLAVKGSKLTSAKVLHADRFGGGLLNVKVDPKVGPGSVTPFGIASNDQTSLTLQDPKSTLAKHTAIGATLRSLYVFDHLHMGGGATWDASGADVLITSGALLSSDKTVFTGQGGVRAERLVLAGVKKLVFSGGETTLGPLTTAAGEGLAIDILGGTVHLGSRTIASLNISGGAKVTGANLAVKGAAKIDASTATIGQLRVSGDLTTTGKTTLSITDDILEVDGMLTLGKSGVLTIPTGYKDKQVKRLLVTAGSVILQPTSIVDLNYRGYPVNTTLYPESKYLPGNRAGGCHAGRGVISSTSSAYCTTFDDPTWPVWPGGGGGVGANGNGHGGGVVHFTVAGNMAIQGTIRANGQSNAYSGPGAGGSIAITAKSVSGFGSVQAHGGGGGSVCVKYRKTYPYNCILYYRSGGGGGGMIAIVDTAAMADGFAHAALHKHAVAYGGGRWDGWRGGHGTVYVRQSGKKYGDLLVRGTPSLKSVWPTVLTMVPEGNVVSAGPKTINNPGTFLAGVWAGQFVSVHVNEGAPRPLDNSVARVVANTIDTLTFLTSFDISKVTGIGKNYRGILHLDSLDIADYGKLSVTGDLVIHGGDRTWNDSKKFALGTGSTLAGQNIDFAGNNKTDTKMTGVTVGKPLGRVYCTDCGASGLILQ